MIEPSPLYDEIGSRTRQAWLRTGLSAAAVSLLVLRGVVIGGGQAWLMATCLVPGVGFVGLTVIRMRRIQHGQSPGLPVLTSMLVLAAACGIAAAAAASVPGAAS